MPLCPNCGSWVPEGEPTCCCGASLGSYYTQNVDSKEIEEKIMKDIRRNREKRLRKEAAHLADQGRYAEAIERYKKALDVNYSSEVLIDIGDVYCKMEDYNEALFYYSSIENDSWDKFKKRAHALYELGRFDDAVHELRQAIEYFSEHWKFKVEFHNEWADDEGYVKRYQYQHDMKKRQKNELLSKIYNELGWTYHLHEDYDMAIECYEKGIQLNPDYANNLNCKAISLEKKHEYVKALEFYDAALKIDVDDETLLENKRGCMTLYGEEYLEGRYSLESPYLEESLKLAGGKQGKLNRKPPKDISKVQIKTDFDIESDYLNDLGKANLVTITGTAFYDSPKFKNGMEFKLVKERDNEYDGNAIAVYLDGVKVGYVANDERTCCSLTSKASDILIGNVAQAEYVMHFADRYHIAQITGWG